LDRIEVTFDQHWSRDWCDTCQEAHRISEFGICCESTDCSDDAEGRARCSEYVLPSAIQEEPGESSSLFYVNLATTIIRDCEAWADEGDG
jgi:hypothetical protein